MDLGRRANGANVALAPTNELAFCGGGKIDEREMGNGGSK